MQGSSGRLYLLVGRVRKAFRANREWEPVAASVNCLKSVTSRKFFLKKTHANPSSEHCDVSKHAPLKICFLMKKYL